MNLALIFLAGLLQVTPPHKVTVSYDAYPGATRFTLWRAPLLTDPAGNDVCGAFHALGNTVALQNTDTSVISGGRYCYRVTATVAITPLGATTPAVLQESDPSDPALIAIIP